NAEPTGGLAAELDRFVGVLDLREHERDTSDAGGPAALARGVLLLEHAVEREQEERPRRATRRLEGLATLGPQERVGIMPGGECRNPETEATARERVRAPAQRPPLRIRRALEEILGAPCGFLPGAVGVEEEDRLVGVAAEEPEL